MKVVVLHSEVAEGASRDEEDVLVQVRVVSAALSALCYDPVPVPFSLNIPSAMAALASIRPAFVFNLVETIDGSGRLIHVAPSVLDHLHIPYTGAPSEAAFLTSNKLTAKRLLESSNIPTPRWITRKAIEKQEFIPNRAYIIKSVWEHASIGLSEDSIISAEDASVLHDQMEARRERLGGECFAEEYIDGREFNLSILAGKEGPVVLPPAEIRFDSFPADKAKVVDYRAKWEPESFEYHNTPRSFDFASYDASLLSRLKDLAGKCWSLFGLRGYARVDFRVDQSGRASVLEVNTNPCLSPDAGFAAAAERAGIEFNEVIKRIVEDSIACGGDG
jgi:D-alanine-D-alanine ligase